MKILNLFKFLLILALSINALNAQVIIQPTALNTPFFNFDHLLKVRLVNGGSSTVSGIVQVMVEDNQSNVVLQMNSLPLELKVGQVLQHHEVKWEGNLTFGSSEYAQSLSQRAKLPNGQYVYCYRFLDSVTGRSIGSHCQENTTMNFQLPELLFPFDKDTVMTLFPVLSWRPPIPILGNELNYSVKLVEVLDGQSTLDAIYANVPLLEKHHLRSPALPYPPTAIALKYEATYAWQVIAYYGSETLGKTDLWQFTLAETESQEEEEPESESFRFVRKNVDGASYIFTKNIYLAYDNRNGEAQLNYTIYPKIERTKSFHQLPEVSLQPGLNQITLPISNQIKLKDNVVYILEVTNEKEEAFYLEFLYNSKLQKQ